MGYNSNTTERTSNEQEVHPRTVGHRIGG
jgi:hypothetical protein